MPRVVQRSRVWNSGSWRGVISPDHVGVVFYAALVSPIPHICCRPCGVHCRRHRSRGPELILAGGPKGPCFAPQVRRGIVRRHRGERIDGRSIAGRACCQSLLAAGLHKLPEDEGVPFQAWRAVRVGVDGALYGGVWALPTGKSNRRSLYALLEQVTFEALKRAQLVPNFETRISIAKKRGILPGSSAVNSSQNAISNAYISDLHQRTQARRENLHNLIISHQPASSSKTAPPPPPITTNLQQTNHSSRSSNSSSSSTTGGNRSPISPTEKNQNQISKLMFNKTSHSTMIPSSPRSPTSPAGTKSAGLLPSLRITRDMGVGGGVVSPNGSGSPSSSFFQNPQRVNATPVTMTNPFAKLTNFVNSYIVLQEFCKELAAVILVRHATNYNEIGFIRYQEQREAAMLGSNPTSAAAAAAAAMIAKQDWLMDDMMDDDEEERNYKQRNFDKWKNRISVVSTIADWRSVRSLDTIDEAITARVPSRTTGSIEGIQS